MVDSEAQVKTSRPCLGINARARSYLQDHQQYRPPQQDGIDSIVEGGRAANPDLSEKPFNQYNGVPSPKIPFMIVDSKLTHAYSHTNCQPVPGRQPDSLIATILYKTKSPQPQSSRHSRDHSPSPTQDKIAVIPPALAPVRSISSFPFEPPPPDPDPLDRLYGSYISPICLTSFLHLFSSLPSRQGAPPLVSSHRCLDNPNHPLAIEITLSPTPDPSYLTLSDLRKHELIYRFEREWNVDVILQQDSVFRRYPRLVCFDMDSTLIKEEVIDLIAASIGVEAEVSAITEQAMNGELDFRSSLKARVKLLRGVKEDIFVKLREVITPTNGARELLRALKRLGVRTAVFSGGFSPTTKWLARELGIDYAYANNLSVDDGILTGEVEGTIVDRERKRELLIEVAEKEGISLSQVVAVGDGANDLSMLGAAGLGVAWNAKPLVQMEAHARLNGTSLLDLLFLFGFTVGEIEKLLC